MKALFISVCLIISALSTFDPHMAPQQTIKYPSIKVTYIIDDYSYIQTTLCIPYLNLNHGSNLMN